MYLAGDVGGRRRTKKGDHSGYIIRSTDTPQLDTILKFGSSRWIAQEVCRHVCGDKARLYQINPNPSAPDFFGEGLGESDQPSLRGRICALSRVPVRADEAANVDHAASALRSHHPFQHRLRKHHGADQVGIDYRGQVARICSQEQQVCTACAGVVNQNVWGKPKLLQLLGCAETAAFRTNVTAYRCMLRGGARYLHPNTSSSENGRTRFPHHDVDLPVIPRLLPALPPGCGPRPQHGAPSSPTQLRRRARSLESRQ